MQLNMKEFIGFSVDPNRIFIHTLNEFFKTHTHTIQYNSKIIIIIIFLLLLLLKKISKAINNWKKLQKLQKCESIKKYINSYSWKKKDERKLFLYHNKSAVDTIDIQIQ